MGGDSAGLAQFDPYAILGIELGADAKDIKRAYRSLSLQYHPDKNPGNKMAEDMFMKIAKAYEALTDATVGPATATVTIYTTFVCTYMRTLIDFYATHAWICCPTAMRYALLQ
jgi:DnaJ domain